LFGRFSGEDQLQAPHVFSHIPRSLSHRAQVILGIVCPTQADHTMRQISNGYQSPKSSTPTGTTRPSTEQTSSRSPAS
jgi:hypothetical protein